MTIDLTKVFPETKLNKKYLYWPHKPIENLQMSLGESSGPYIICSGC